MFNKICFALIISMISFSNSNAQTINGKVIDKDSKPQEFVNILLLKAADSSLHKGTITDVNGDFLFEDMENGNYLVAASMVGYTKTYTDAFELSESNKTHSVGDILFLEDAATLDAAMVYGQKPFIEHQLDKTVVNVENSIISAGSTALEVLQRSPGIMVDKDGNITMKGKPGVTIMIDGKQTYLSMQDVSNMLKSMPADQLEKIELITNPSAKYDAAGTGGIINLVMKKNTMLGLNGRVNAGYTQGFYPKFNGGGNINYRWEKVNLFTSYSANHRTGFSVFDLDRKFRVGDNFESIYSQTSWGESKSLNQNAKFAVDFYPNKKHTIGFFVNGMFADEKSVGYNNTDIYGDDAKTISLGQTNTSNDVKDNWQNISGNINYKWNIDSTGKELTANLDYGYYNNATSQYYKTTYYDSAGVDFGLPDILTSSLPSEVDVKSGKIDYVHPIGKKAKFEAGVKSSYVVTDNNAQFYNVRNDVSYVDSTKTNRFKYTENINAVYTNFASELGKKWNGQIGLRLEQTIAKGEQITIDSIFTRDYLNFFPSAFLNYKANEKHEFSASYSRRIDRPDYQSLNPFLYFLDPYTYMKGNTLLLPQYTDAFELSHTFMGFMSTSLSYSHTSGVMTHITEQVDSTHTSFSSMANLQSLDNYGFSTTLPIPITKWWMSMNFINVFYNRYKGEIGGTSFDSGRPAWMINSTNSITMKNGWSAEIGFFYMAKQVHGIFFMNPMSNLSFGIQKKIMKDRGMLKLSASDMLYKQRWSGSIQFDNMDIQMWTRGDSRTVSINFSYKFGDSKSQYQRKTSGASDELDRIGGGGGGQNGGMGQ
jgi:iron complex outermembrane receptor protein